MDTKNLLVSLYYSYLNQRLWVYSKFVCLYFVTCVFRQIQVIVVIIQQYYYTVLHGITSFYYSGSHKMKGTVHVLFCVTKHHKLVTGCDTRNRGMILLTGV